MALITFLSLGGASKIGMNCYLYETETTAIMIDCGTAFIDDHIAGIDRVIPNFNYLYSIRDKFKAVIFTHGHEDHIGAVTYLFDEFDLDVIATRYTHKLIDYKLKKTNQQIKNRVYLEDTNEIIIDNITITPIPISHSIPGSVAIYLRFIDGFTILHISDYKIDFSPYSSTAFSIKPFLKIASENLNCIVADSTNANKTGFTSSENSIKPNLLNIISNSKGRVFFTTFASNIERLQLLFDIIEATNKYIVIEGAALVKNIDIARKSSELLFDNKRVVDRKQIDKYPDTQLVILTTGSQAEYNSIINRISFNDYANINIKPSDTFIFSSRIIPGNESKIIELTNRIYQYGAVTIFDQNNDIHSSGHASADDIVFMLKLLQPDYLIPIHGEDNHRLEHKRLAVEKVMMSDSSVIIAKVGEQINFIDGMLDSTTSIDMQPRYIDAFTEEILTGKNILERRDLARFGAISITIIIDLDKGTMAYPPFISLFGVNADTDLRSNIISHLNYSVDHDIFERKVLSAWKEYIFQVVKKYFRKKYNKKIIISINIEEV